MLNKQHLVLSALALSVLLNPISSLLAHANDWEPGQGKAMAEGFHQKQEQRLQELGLSAEKTAQIKSILQQGHKVGRANMEQVHQQRQNLMEGIRNGSINESQAKSQNQSINQLMSQLGENRIHTLFQVKSQMTAEQFEKFMAFPKQGREGGGRRLKNRS